MPAEKIELKQKQGRLFHQKLSIELNPKHKLYKLRELINWSELESGVSQIVNVKRYGRAKKDLRVMLGLSMLQAMYNFSDCLTIHCWCFRSNLSIFIFNLEGKTISSPLVAVITSLADFAFTLRRIVYGGSQPFFISKKPQKKIKT